MKPIQVLNLATSLNGGAGIAARRTHESLVDAGVDSHLLVMRASDESIQFGISKIQMSRASNFLSKSTTILQRDFMQNSNRLVTPISMGTLSRRNLQPFNPEVIHVHAYYNLLSAKEIWELGNWFPKSRVVITMHDERFFTGGCHYTGGCLSYQSECRKCPQVSTIGEYFVRKSHEISVTEKKQNYKIITPSVWLAERARLSTVLMSNSIFTVSNPVPKIFFDQYAKLRSSSEFNIAFISQDLNNPYKGIETIIEAVSRIDQIAPVGRVVINFVGRGEIPLQTKNVEVRKLSIESEQDMAKFLGGMNLVLLASTEDNMPNVVLESLAAGARVIGTDIGGIKEVLRNFSLSAFLPGDSETLTLMILKEINSRFDKPNEDKCQEFNYLNVSKKLIDIYSS